MPSRRWYCRSCRGATRVVASTIANPYQLALDETHVYWVAAGTVDFSGTTIKTGTDGRIERARFLITAIGPLSAPTMPDIAGVSEYRGEAYHTGLWPHRPVSFEGKRVGVIGTGATAVAVGTASFRDPGAGAKLGPCPRAANTGSSSGAA